MTIMHFLSILFWFTGFLLALGCLLIGWSFTGGQVDGTGERGQSLIMFFVTVAPVYLMLVGLWPCRWNFILTTLRKTLVPEWGMVVLDWLTVGGLIAFPVIGAIMAVAEKSFLPEIYGWVWMVSLGAVHLLRRKTLKACIEGEGG